MNIKRIFKNIKRKFKYHYLRLIRQRGDPAHLARSVALGVSINILPTFGLGVVFAYLIAAILRYNKVAAVLSALMVKLFIPFLVVANYFVGRILLGGPERPVRPDEVDPGLDHIIQQTGLMSFLNDLWQRLIHLGWPFLVGSAVNAAVAAVVVYFIAYKVFSYRRERRRLAQLRRAR